MSGFKRLAIYFTVLVGCLFVGLTTYYLVKNYEFINVQADSSMDAVYVNVGETLQLDFTHDLKQTELAHSWSEEGLASFNAETGEITGIDVGENGETQLTITAPDNEKFGPFVFTVRIGNGEVNTPYYIKNQADLQAIGGTRVYSEEKSVKWDPSANYRIVDDIDLEGEFTPLCKEEVFSGTLEGQLKTISNLRITKDQLSTGLFSQIGDLATVSSIIFENPVIDGRFDFAGVVAGASWGATVELIQVNNGVVKASPYGVVEKDGIVRQNVMTGGIVGVSTGVGIETESLKDRGIITMCSFEGVIGTNQSANEVTQTATVSYFSQGGIVGSAQGATIYNTKADVKFEIDSAIALKAQEYERGTENPEGICFEIGGIAGQISNLRTDDDKEIITDENGNLKVNGESVDESAIEIKFAPIIRNNLAIVKTNAQTTSVGGIVGHLPINVQLISNERWVVGNYFYCEDETITEGGSVLGGATNKISSKKDLNSIETYVVLGEGTWDIEEVSDYSSKVWLIEEGKEPKINLDASFNDDVRFEAEKYEIATEEDFVKYYNFMNNSENGNIVRRYYLKQNYVLNTDIDVAKLIEDGKIEKFEPIGGSNLAYEGIFDGNGKTIKSIVFENGSGENFYRSVGLFAQLSKTAEVKNLKVENITLNNGYFVGGIAGVNFGTINNCFVENVSVSGATYSGGISGINYGTIIGNVEVVEAVNFYSFEIDGSDWTINEEKTKATDFMGLEYEIADDKFVADNIEYSIDWASMTISYIEYVTEIVDNKFSNDVEYIIDWENGKVSFGEQSIAIVEGKFTIGEGEAAVEYTINIENGVVSFGENQTLTIAENKFVIGEGETAVEYTINMEANKILFGKQTVELSNNSFSNQDVKYVLNKEKGIAVFGETIETTIEERNGDWLNDSLGNITGDSSKILINNSDAKAYAGAITGINHGEIKGVVIPGDFTISAEETQSELATRVLGGFVGYNTGLVENCYGYNISINDISVAKIYVGGFAGINSGIISKASIGGEMRDGGLSVEIVTSLKDGEQVAGGFVGILTETGLIEYSTANVKLEGKQVGGFAPYLFGEVKESYVGGIATGNQVGGFAIHMVRNNESQTGGHIIDCINKLTLTGTGNNPTVAGISVFVRYLAKIERSIMSCKFSGEGTFYYESLTNTREGFLNWVTSWMDKQNRLGTITNVIVIKTENQNVKESKAIISYNNQVVKYLTEEEISALTEDDYKQLEFLTKWNVEGATPLIKSVEGLHGKTQII